MNSLFLAAMLYAPSVDRLADAIYHAEGGKKAKVAYGILSVKVRNERHAREVCKRTIVSAMRRYDCKEDFITFLGRTYCPDDTKTWVKNVTYFYRHPK